MTRLTWGSIDERYYELGLDQGVLYPQGQSGVAWNGLISVDENSSGGDPRPYYIDGIKYLNLSSTEEFEATITAFNIPEEFNECDGAVSIQNGLFVTQQPRKPFGLSYRTKIGNASSSSHGYKIHLVYNALTEPSQKSNNTISDSSNPLIFNFPITTLPPEITGYKRTAHMVIDSRYTSSGVLSYVEDILYGSDSESPQLPSPDDLITIFSS